MKHRRTIASFLLASVAALGANEVSGGVRDLAAAVAVDGRRARIRWTTTLPTRCKVEYGPTTAYGRVADEDSSSLRGTTNNWRAPGKGVANNHRADIPMLSEGILHCRVRAASEDGKEIVTPDFLVRPPGRARSRPGVQGLKVSIDRGAWQVAKPDVVLGVPFPSGHLARTNDLRLVTQQGEIPSQTSAVSRYWTDGTVKWARVAFQAPDRGQEVTLEYGANVKRATDKPLDVSINGRAFRVRTSALSLTCDDHGSGSIQATGTASLALPRPVLVDKAGKRFMAAPEHTVVEEVGPVRVVVRVVGHHVADDGAKLFAYVERFYVFAGKPYLRLDYTFENDVVTDEMTSIRSIGLAVGRGDAHVAVATDTGSRVLKPGQAVFQREDFEWVDETGKKGGRRLPGIIDLGSARIMVKNFWQQYPKSFAADSAEVCVYLLPPLPKGFYAARKDEDKLYYYLRDGMYTFRQGLSKTHELWVDMGKCPGAASLIRDGATAAVPAKWIEDSGALRNLAVRDRDKFPGYDEAFTRMASGIPKRRESRRELGMMNFGDWHGERTWNWGNLEYDLGHGMLTQFARTGEGPLFWRAQEAVRHQGDVDTRHYASDTRRVGQQWTHCMGHTAGYYPATYKNMKVYAYHGWSDNRGHIWAQGLLEHHLLGGDRRSWVAGLLISDWAAGPQTTNFYFGNAREPGWMLRLVMSAYFATDDPYYLNAARLMVQAVRRRSEETGNRGFYNHRLPTGHCYCEKKHYGEAGFMLGVLMTGLKMYYDATLDERAADDTVGIARFICDTMWDEERYAFRYTSCPETGASHGSMWIMMEGLGFAAARTDDERLKRICRASLAAAWSGFSAGGKSSGYMTCSSAQALHEFAQIPGPSFKAYRDALVRELQSPARRCVPTLLNNPDFEETIHGWPARGGAISLDTGVKHSGRQSLRFEGSLVRQNEYVNTCYDTSADPGEIKSLVPNETYRLTCWLRVDKLTPGTPAPSVRLAFRDAGGTRGSAGTNSYGLAKMGTWQKLSADIKIPEWNTRNYMALNTKTQDKLEALLYLDDISLVPAKAATKDTYTYMRLAPKEARRSGKMRLVKGRGKVQPQWLEGRGRAVFTVTVPETSEYVVWVRAHGSGALATISAGPKPIGTLAGPGASWAWVRACSLGLEQGARELAFALTSEGGRIGRIVLTDDPSCPTQDR